MLAADQSAVLSGEVFNAVTTPSGIRGWSRARSPRSAVGSCASLFLPYPVVWSLMLAVDLLSSGARPRHGHRALSPGAHARRYALPRAAARQDLGWSPRVGLEAGLASTLAAQDPKPYPW